ncbi:hypothetical protein BUALT_Bualt10G0124300 [Buddleja alternifolia]|uniref:LOB domain-containing protein n=1 Tax=Buddleja alternifolia TaxID=168488 RepID=A0AAV6X5F2_9LAMI|nr:hypothetical protein BUALT_Bualt10G0124300 [Buddleja alternifolia]
MHENLPKTMNLGNKNDNTTSAVPNRKGPGGGGATIVPQACAACKYQRRRCAPDCPLAPYFSGDKPKDFLNAHKLFGVSNILKILKNVPIEHRGNAMRSVVFEANVRAIDPVGGCHQMILDLESKINICKMEFNLLLRQLHYYRSKRFQMANRDNVYVPIQETTSDEELLKLKSIEIGEDVKPDVHQQYSNQFSVFYTSRNLCCSANEMPKADDDSKNPEH